MGRNLDFLKKRRGRPSEALINPSLKSKTEKGIIVRIIIQADSSFVRPLYDCDSAEMVVNMANKNKTKKFVNQFNHS